MTSGAFPHTTQPTVLFVDDDVHMGATVVRGLAKLGMTVVHVTSAKAALEAIDANAALEAVVTDVRMHGMDGLTLSERIAEKSPELPVIVVTGFGSLETAIRAIRAGAYDFLTKPFEIDALHLALTRAIQHKALREEVRRLRSEGRRAAPSDEMVGRSPAMQCVYDLVSRVADAEVSVLITGETGTGKELVARALHRQSRRVAGPFVVVNCAALPEALLESELFGHSKGAFTDAHSARKGLFVQAHGGTLFLDEIGDLPLALQPKLLRALQERVIRPLGTNTEVPVDVRVIAATHRDLEQMVEERSFREDLYYRLNVVTIDLPPLRARGNDVLLLAQHFLEAASARANKPLRGIRPEAAERLLAYPWPGNVRELANCIERAVALTRHDEITVEDLPPKVREHERRSVVVVPEHPDELLPMDEIERRYVEKVMEAVGGNKSQAAAILGWDRKRLYRKLEKYGLLRMGTRKSEPPVG
jgi:two-component system response regulator HydG